MMDCDERVWAKKAMREGDVQNRQVHGKTMLETQGQ